MPQAHLPPLPLYPHKGAQKISWKILHVWWYWQNPVVVDLAQHDDIDLWGHVCMRLLSIGNLVVMVKACHMLADKRMHVKHPGYFSLGMNFNTPLQVTGLNTRGREEEHWPHSAMVRLGVVFSKIITQVWVATSESPIMQVTMPQVEIPT
jgi:hypothetical protein